MSADANDLRPKASARQAARWVALFLALMAFLPVADRPLHEPDEGRYGLIGQTMLRTGNWLEPEYLGKLHLTKPPFAYWATAASQAVFGHGTFGVRFPAALAFFLTGLVTMALARRLLGARAAAPAGLVWGTMPLTFGVGQFMNTDMIVAFWQALGVLAAVSAWQRPERPGAWRLLFWFAFGMAFFTKGPPGLLGMIPVAWGSWRRRRRGEPRVLWSWGALGVFLVTSTWWYILLAVRHPGLVQYWVGDEFVRRVATTQHARNRTPLLYLGDLTLGVLPWMFLYVPLVGRLRRWWGSRPRVTSASGVLLAIWILVPLTVFLVARSRMPAYVVPLCVPLALVFASLLLPRLESLWKPRSLAWLGAWAVLLLTLNHLEPRVVRPGWDAHALAGQLAEGTDLAAVQILNATGMHMSSLDAYRGTGDFNVEIDRLALQRATAPEEATALGVVPDPEGHPTWLLVRISDLDRLQAALAGLDRAWTGSWLAAYRL